MAMTMQNLSISRRKVLIKFSLLLLGTFLVFSAYLTLFGLQSSINIQDGVGVASGTATYVTAAVFGITITPILLRSFGVKLCVILCELTYLVYILANFYPTSYTLIPAGVIVGIGEATIWPALILFCVHYAKSFARYSTKESAACVVEFMGVFYFVIHLSGVFGSLLTYGILYRRNSSFLPDNENTTSSPPIVRDLSVCGRNDCQDPNITNENIGNYVPAEKILVYILLAVMTGLVLFAMLIHGIFIKNIAKVDEDTAPNSVSEDKNNNEKTNDELSILQSILFTLKQTGWKLIHPKQLLLAPFALYCGFVAGFLFIEIPRAFGSCIIGVEFVGLLSALSKGADALMSYASCKISSRTGRHFPMFLAFCVDIAFSMAMLFWIPTEPTIWVIYIFFILMGIVDGFWQPLITEVYNSYFPGEEDIALTIWNTFLIVGLAWQAGWSTSLCVYQKIYFQISWLCFSTICYGISQFMYYKRTPKEIKENATNVETITKL